MVPIQIAFRRSDGIVDSRTLFGTRTADTALTAIPRAPHSAPLDLFNVDRIPHFPSHVVQFLNLIGGHDYTSWGLCRLTSQDRPSISFPQSIPSSLAWSADLPGPRPQWQPPSPASAAADAFCDGWRIRMQAGGRATEAQVAEFQDCTENSVAL
jgi:hypothetical protein